MRACYPGSFDPLTVAHVAIAGAVVEQCDRVSAVSFVLSRSALGKATHSLSLEERCAAIEACGFPAVVTDAQLLADIADGYGVLVLGADKLAQVLDPLYYGGSVAARDAAVARLPRLAVAPRVGFELPAADARVSVLRLDPSLAAVSSTAVRSGVVEWSATAASAAQTRQSPE